jgi:hypothetical protein
MTADDIYTAILSAEESFVRSHGRTPTKLFIDHPSWYRLSLSRSYSGMIAWGRFCSMRVYRCTAWNGTSDEFVVEVA